MNRRVSGLALAAFALVSLGACEFPTGRNSQEMGYRGVGMWNVSNTRIDAAKKKVNQLPPVIPAVAADTTNAGYVNVQVLGHLNKAEFLRSMTAITAWVAPKQGCLYCHYIDKSTGTINYASDSMYTKVVARRMIQMTAKVNSEYQGHVAKTGVACWTCHRGNAVPANIWFFTDKYQVLRHYLDRQDFRVQSQAALPNDAQNRSSIKQTEYAYGLMINMSTALGVNCTYCHNSRAWSSWEQSSPKRIVALRGIRMVRDLNTNYLVSLTGVWPANRLGPLHADAPKLQCATCHNGIYKPMYGQAMAKDYPFLYPAGMTPGADAPTGMASSTPAQSSTPVTPASAPVSPAVPAQAGASTTLSLR